jgi:hypothetical protein
VFLIVLQFGINLQSLDRLQKRPEICLLLEIGLGVEL